MEILREKRKAIIAVSLAVAAAAALYFFAAVPYIVSVYRQRGGECLASMDYPNAIEALERADFFAIGQRIDVALPLGRAYIGDGQYARAVAVLEKYASHAGGQAGAQPGGQAAEGADGQAGALAG
ncbi:MAG: hypothetical protein LBJ10_09005, partial [Clostridiales bacterium]|nr:hypothetical protein [Clostridiales bacterium]